VLVQRIGAHKWSSAKNFNNHLIALRGIFKLHFRGRLMLDDPTSGIENRPVVKKRPDPLTSIERDRILSDMAEHYDPRVEKYFKFQFYSGLRPEETIALQWGDLDEATGTLQVRRVRTFRGSERDGSKTHAEREVDLVGPALEALIAMKAYTFGEQDLGRFEADIFRNPVTGRAWHDERSQRDHYWKPSLERCGIRPRRAYTTRHTFCTSALMAGVNPAYIAAQAGHSLKMLLEVYAKWISGADGGSERDRLRVALAGNSSPILPQTAAAQKDKAPSSEEKTGPNIGRRDWTRTNDPHHVKDVDLPCLTMT
jgi:integrase